MDCFRRAGCPRSALWVVLGSGSLLSCQAPCAVTASPLGPHTAEIHWAHPSSSAQLTFGHAGELERTTPLVWADEGWAADLIGLPALSDVYYRLVSDEQTCDGVFATTNLPATLPVLSVSKLLPAEMSAERYVVGVVMGAGDALFVLDRLGQWRWHYQHDPAVLVSDVHLDGREILFNSYDEARIEDIGQVHRIDLAGQTLETIRTEGGHHVFAPLPDGGVAFPSVDTRAWVDPKTGEALQVVGDRILEVAPDGTVREVFTIWDHEEPVRTDAWDDAFYAFGVDWSHANALSYHPGRDSYLLSLGHLEVIYEIDRSSGDVLQRFSADQVISGSGWTFQHDPNWTEDETLLLVSHEEGSTWAREYTVDSGLQEVWSQPGIESGFLGQTRRLSNGNTLINYGGKGVIREVTPDGEIVWEIEAALGSWFGNVVLADALFSL